MRLGEEAPWGLSLYPDAGEGGGCLLVRRATEPSGNPPDLARSSSEASRRARGKIRRYCAANGLNPLGTLTYAGEGCHDPRAVRADLGVFFKELRTRTGEAVPYVWVPQLHPGGHGWHVHFGVGRFIPRRAIEQAWGRGFVHIKLLSDLPVGSGTRSEARLTARYLAGYAGRDLDEQSRPAGLHRYEVAQGFQPEKLLVYGESADDVIERASGYMRAAPERVWLSSSVEGWRGPPACWAQWA